MDTEADMDTNTTMRIRYSILIQIIDGDGHGVTASAIEDEIDRMGFDLGESTVFESLTDLTDQGVLEKCQGSGRRRPYRIADEETAREIRWDAIDVLDRMMRVFDSGYDVDVLDAESL